MHQTRRTHNAHNETQRRLKRILSKGPFRTYFSTPHYSYIDHRYGVSWYVADWVNPHWSYSVRYNVKGGFLRFSSFEESEFARKHRFLVKKSKSSGRHSFYKSAKKQMHRLWRRRGFDETSYTIRGSYCSWYDLIL